RHSRCSSASCCSDPFGPLTPAQIPQAVGNLLGVAPGKGLIVNEKGQSGFAIANFSQYLFLKDDPASVAEKLRTGKVFEGIGIFGRFGSAPTEPIRSSGTRALHYLHMACSTPGDMTALAWDFITTNSAAT